MKPPSCQEKLSDQRWRNDDDGSLMTGMQLVEFYREELDAAWVDHPLEVKQRETRRFTRRILKSTLGPELHRCYIVEPDGGQERQLAKHHFTRVR